jgi:uncharacterized protein (TIGR03435 family)
MSSLSEWLSRMPVVGRRVVDETGLTGGYTINVRDTPQPGLSAAPPAAGTEPAPIDPNAPDIFIALEEQLGLKLESRRGEMKVLVIDHIERPTPD